MREVGRLAALREPDQGRLACSALSKKMVAEPAGAAGLTSGGSIRLSELSASSAGMRKLHCRWGRRQPASSARGQPSLGAMREMLRSDSRLTLCDPGIIPKPPQPASISRSWYATARFPERITPFA